MSDKQKNTSILAKLKNGQFGIKHPKGHGLQ